MDTGKLSLVLASSTAPPPLPDPSQFFARRLTLSHLHLHLHLCLHLCVHLCAATTSQHFCSGPFQWPRRLSPGFFPKEKPPSRFLVICLLESAQSHFWLQRSPTPPPLQSLNSLRVIKRLVSPARLSPYISFLPLIHSCLLRRPLRASNWDVASLDRLAPSNHRSSRRHLLLS